MEELVLRMGFVCNSGDVEKDTGTGSSAVGLKWWNGKLLAVRLMH